jgi:hypothetical protein
LGFGGKYKLTAGGSELVFQMPTAPSGGSGTSVIHRQLGSTYKQYIIGTSNSYNSISAS